MKRPAKTNEIHVSWILIFSELNGGNILILHETKIYYFYLYGSQK
jgi:hypothetical protein